MSKWTLIVAIFIMLTLTVTNIYTYNSFSATQVSLADAENSIGNLKQHKQRLAEEKAELERQNSELLNENDRLRRLASRNSYESNPTSDDKTVFLTFDDGPSDNTVKVLDILKEYGVKATFFVCGTTTEYGHSLYRRIVEEGHAIGNHTFTHTYGKVYVSEESFMEDFQRLEDEVFAATGVRPQIMRFPGGSNNYSSRSYGGNDLMDKLTQRVLEQGYQYFDWNVDSRDSAKIPQDKQVIIDSVVNGVKNKKASIVLMHDSKSRATTVEALPAILEKLSAKGYKFEVLTPDSFTIHFQN